MSFPFSSIDPDDEGVVEVEMFEKMSFRCCGLRLKPFKIHFLFQSQWWYREIADSQRSDILKKMAPEGRIHIELR